MKAIFELDMPESCDDCILSGLLHCLGLEEPRGIDGYSAARAPFCPLKIVEDAGDKRNIENPDLDCIAALIGLHSGHIKDLRKDISYAQSSIIEAIAYYSGGKP